MSNFGTHKMQLIHDRSLYKNNAARSNALGQKYLVCSYAWLGTKTVQLVQMPDLGTKIFSLSICLILGQKQCSLIIRPILRHSSLFRWQKQCSLLICFIMGTKTMQLNPLPGFCTKTMQRGCGACSNTQSWDKNIQLVHMLDFGTKTMQFNHTPNFET